MFKQNKRIFTNIFDQTDQTYHFERHSLFFSVFFGRPVVLNVVPFFKKKRHNNKKEKPDIFAIKLRLFSSLL